MKTTAEVSEALLLGASEKISFDIVESMSMENTSSTLIELDGELYVVTVETNEDFTKRVAGELASEFGIEVVVVS